MKQNVFIVILHFGQKENTIECLKSIEKLHAAGYTLHVVVVDNGTENKFKIQNSKFKIIRNEENLGFAQGNNVGIAYALENGADYILILNNDTIVDKNLVSELAEVSQSDEAIGIVAPKIYFAKGFEFHKSRYKKDEQGKVIWYAGGEMDWQNVIGHHRGVDEVDLGQYDKTEETGFASGCAMLIKRSVFEKIGPPAGGFDPKYFLYYEDSDFSQKAKTAEFEIVFAPKAVLWHKNAGSAGGSGSSLQDYYITRNRLFFGMRYAPLRSKLALLRESLRLLINGRPWQRKGVLDFYLGKLGKGSYPL